MFYNKERVNYMDLTLETIEIKNFLSYRQAKFVNIKNYNVLIGKNSSGKSNLFKIFEMIRNNYSNRKFSKYYLFEANEDLQAEIILIFKLSNTIRRKLFKLLYKGNFLRNAFLVSETTEGYLKRKEWNKEEIAINWLLEQGYYCKVEVKISYIRELNTLIITQISLIHQNLNNPQILFNSLYINKSFDAHIIDLKQLSSLKNPFNYFFTDFHKVKVNISQNNLETIFHSNMVKNQLILGPILELVSNLFFTAIHHIPDKRKFDPESERDNIAQTNLDVDGKNLVKFIHKKIVMNEKDWINQFNSDLKHFIPDIDELGQNINASTDRAMLILKENGLDMELKVENMGSGILNIALFIAYIMELGEDKILCIEEPELYLHPGLEIKLKQKFLDASDKIQIFLTTHSREFLDDNEEKCSIHLIHKENNQSEVNLIPNGRFEEIYNELDMDIEKYKLQKSLIYDESFWVEFIRKAMKRTEDQLWDFKRTLDMWFGEPKIKEKKQVEFCEKIASFANAEGGVIILGITDKIPREITGIEDIENRKKSVKTTLQKYINVSKDFTMLKEILIKDAEGMDRNCLVCAIAQTKDPIEVRGLNKSYSYPIRLGPGLDKVDKLKIQQAKKSISQDNYDFILNLQKFVLD